MRDPAYDNNWKIKHTQARLVAKERWILIISWEKKRKLFQKKKIFRQVSKWVVRH